jgi:D-glycero-alpha-D-manno-heptose-7-phosphate kinase
LGSSSAFTVGLIKLCCAYNKEKQPSRLEAANTACEIEIDELCGPIGKQDQYACSVGGLNFFSFNEDNTVTAEKIDLRKKELNQLEQRL